MVWKAANEPSLRKFKTVPFAGKVSCAVFWDKYGVIPTEYLTHGNTVTAARYCETLFALRKAIKRKRPGLVERKVVLIQDNARPHSAAITRAFLTDFGWDIFDHPPYSPDVTRSDYHYSPS